MIMSDRDGQEDHVCSRKKDRGGGGFLSDTGHRMRLLRLASESMCATRHCCDQGRNFQDSARRDADMSDIKGEEPSHHFQPSVRAYRIRTLGRIAKVM